MVMFWVAILAVSTLLYVLLDGFDLGIGISVRIDAPRGTTPRHVECGCAHLGRQRDMARRDRRRALGSLPDRLRDIVLGVLSSARRHAGGSDPSRSGVRVSLQDGASAVDLGSELCRWISRRGLHARVDRRRSRGRAAVHERPICLAATLAGSRPFAVLCGVGLCLGYALLGACWLVRKCERRGSGRGVSADSRSGDWRAGVPPHRVPPCARRAPSES